MCNYITTLIFHTIGQAGELNIENFQGDATFEIDRFGHLLLSMYDRRWGFRRWDKKNSKQNLQKLKRIAHLADYYDCIPVVANYVTRLMVEEQPLKHFPHDNHGKFKQYIAALLAIGWKLHHKELVQDCTIIAAGEQAADSIRGFYSMGMDLSEFRDDREVEKIKKIIEIVRGWVNKAIVNAHNKLVWEARYGERNDLVRESMSNVAEHHFEPTGLFSYYRALYNRLRTHGLRQEGAIWELLSNNLTFKIEALSDDWNEPFHCLFLCGKVEDTDLPGIDEK